MVARRRVRFEYGPDTDPVWTPRRPEFSCAANSVSLMMPIIEPYFVRSAKRAASLLPPELEAEARGYWQQEAEHHGQHLAFNRLLTDRYRGLGRIEGVMGRIYGRLEQRRSLEFSAAFAAASETMAYSAARWAAEHRIELFTGADEVPASLFLWHLAEEVEHKSVAYDIHKHLVVLEGRPRHAWFRYLAAMLIALLLVVTFVVWGTTVMVAAERRLHHPTTWFRLTRWSVVFAFELLANLTVSLLPGFHPENFTDPLYYTVWLREFDPASDSFPIWSDVDETVGNPTS